MKDIYKKDTEIELAIALENEEQFYNQLMDSLEEDKREIFIKYSFIKDKINILKSALSWKLLYPDDIIWVIFFVHTYKNLGVANVAKKYFTVTFLSTPKTYVAWYSKG